MGNLIESGVWEVLQGESTTKYREVDFCFFLEEQW
jgi:hypothetical protein